MDVHILCTEAEAFSIVRLFLKQGRNYWQKERLICSHLAKKSSEEAVKGFTLADLHAASEGKSFDYRLLNYLLFALRGVDPDRDLMQFLFVDEQLVDIGDDLLDYEAKSPVFQSFSFKIPFTAILSFTSRVLKARD